MKFWLKQVFLAVDQLLNALLNGWADETLSSRAWRQALKGRPMMALAIDVLFFFSPNHCATSYENEKLQKQQHPEIREWLNQQAQQP